MKFGLDEIVEKWKSLEKIIARFRLKAILRKFKTNSQYGQMLMLTIRVILSTKNIQSSQNTVPKSLKMIIKKFALDEIVEIQH